MGLKDDNTQNKQKKPFIFLLCNRFISHDIVQCIDGSMDSVQIRD